MQTPIDLYQEKMEKAWEYSSTAIEEYIEGIVTYGGDATYKIYNAMIEVLEDIKKDTKNNGGLIVDKKGFEEAILAEEYFKI